MSLDEASRVRLSARPETAPEVLHGLAADPSVTVRATLAMNPTLPGGTAALLARDPDERVRALLARKLGALAPTLSGDAQARLRRETLEALTALAEDEAERVRAVIAEAVKDLPDVPRDMVLSLARDPAMTVCEPVIRFSPLLTTDDLLTLVTAAPSVAAPLAVARRAEIGPDVSEALVSHGGEDVILALLMNQSAQIREATLDALAERSAHHPSWHGPLVNRPALSEAAVRTLSRIVADHFLSVLAARGDLTGAAANLLRARVTERLNRTEARPPEDHAKPGEADLMAAARDGDARKAAALLAVAAGVPPPVVRRAVTLRSAKGLVSLVWKAGFSMRTAYTLQLLLARISPAAALKAGPGDSFPLSVREMRWQIDFLSRGNG